MKWIALGLLMVAIYFATVSPVRLIRANEINEASIVEQVRAGSSRVDYSLVCLNQELAMLAREHGYC